MTLEDDPKFAEEYENWLDFSEDEFPDNTHLEQIAEMYDAQKIEESSW